jgi:hypothetical protein
MAPLRVLPYYEIRRGHPAFDPDATVTMQEAHTWAQAAVLLAKGRHQAAEALVRTSARDGPLTIRGLRQCQPCTSAPLLQREQQRSCTRFVLWNNQIGISVQRASAICWGVVRQASHYWYRDCERCTSFQLTWPTGYGYLCDGCLQLQLAYLQTQMPFPQLSQLARAPCPTRAPEGLGLP